MMLYVQYLPGGSFFQPPNFQKRRLDNLAKTLQHWRKLQIKFWDMKENQKPAHNKRNIEIWETWDYDYFEHIKTNEQND